MAIDYKHDEMVVNGYYAFQDAQFYRVSYTGDGLSKDIEDHKETNLTEVAKLLAAIKVVSGGAATLPEDIPHDLKRTISRFEAEFDSAILAEDFISEKVQDHAPAPAFGGM